MSEIISENPVRRNVDITECLIGLEKAAIADSQIEGRLYNVAEYTREVLRQFLRLREYCIRHDMPLYRPEDVTNMIINGEYAKLHP
jgi:hypothetical protein